MATSTQTMPSSTPGAHHVRGESREDCIARLEKGTKIADLSETCKEILSASSKIGVLARRGSAVGRTWNPAEGHNARTYTEVTFGSPNDVPADHRSVGEIFLEGKSPEAAQKIKRSIARTASRGANVRSGEILSTEDVETAERELPRKNSRERSRS